MEAEHTLDITAVGKSRYQMHDKNNDPERRIPDKLRVSGFMPVSMFKYVYKHTIDQYLIQQKNIVNQHVLRY